MKPNGLNITLSRHPGYLRDSSQWEVYRDTFQGGDDYRDRYLEKFGDRETDAEFLVRKRMTPIPTFAKAALLDIRNSLYQRLVGVTRTGGPLSYQTAIAGLDGGVDGEGSDMDTFVGKDVLTELLLMGSVGVYVDAAPPEGPTLADNSYPPYLTYYRAEDILSYSRAPRGKGGQFQSILLRDYNITSATSFPGITLPNGSEQSYRLIWKDEIGQVWYQIYDKAGNAGQNEPVLTGLKQVPFVILDIGDSLLKDVASYQHAALNLISNDINYAIKSNSPFLVIQRDGYASGDHLKKPEGEGGNPTERVGAGKGRYYGINENAPSFINPSTDPLEASMTLQDRLEASIRSLVNLAVQGKAGSRTESAEAKKVGQGSLEAGLSFIGRVLQDGERRIAHAWAEYVNTENPQAAIVNYPDRYTLKDDAARFEEAQELLKLVEKLPGRELKQLVAKQIITALLAGKVPPEALTKMYGEIDSLEYVLSDPSVIIQAHEAGLVDDETASLALGFNAAKVVAQARKDRATRIAATIAAQTPKDEQPVNAAARGAPELDTNPQSGADERANTTTE